MNLSIKKMKLKISGLTWSGHITNGQKFYLYVHWLQTWCELKKYFCGLYFFVNTEAQIQGKISIILDNDITYVVEGHN